MPEVIVFHHALGVTPGINEFADRLRAAGYRVAVPDLFDGRVFQSLEEGVAYAEQIGFDTVIDRGVAAVGDHQRPLVVVGFSLGVMPAQKLAQTRPGVRAAVLCHSVVPHKVFSESWPRQVALQMHLVEQDPWAVEDLQAARVLAAEADGHLFLYPGTAHLVADPSGGEYDEVIADQMLNRMLALLESLDFGAGDAIKGTKRRN